MTCTTLPVGSTVLVAALSVASLAHAEGPEPSRAARTTALPSNETRPADPPPPSTAAGPQGLSDAPLVELSADDGRATIERRGATTSPTIPIVDTGVLSVGQWEHACVAPCQLHLDTRYAYRVAGDGLVPSDSFALPRGQDRVRVDAKMGSAIGRVVGVIAAAGGVLAMAGGGLALAATPILENEDVGSKGFRTGVLVGGIGAVSVGAVSAAVGLVLWLTNGSVAHAEPATARQAAR